MVEKSASVTGRALLRGVRVFDGEDFLPQLQDVRVTDGVIESLTATEASAAEADSPAASGTDAASGDLEVIDAYGHTLTPGIIDCHVHVCFSDAGSLTAFTEPFSLQFYKSVVHLQRTLQAGVTTARDAGGADAGVRHALQTGLISGPDLRLAISIMSQTGGHGDGQMLSGCSMPMLTSHPGRPDGVADGPEGVLRKVREILRAGADQIKICSTGGVLSPTDDPRHSQFTEEEIAVIVSEAHAQGSYVMSHAQGTEGIKNALRAGVRSIEHGIYLDDESIEMMLEAGAFLVPTLQAPMSVIAADAGAPLPPAVVDKARRVAETHAASIAAAYEAGVQIAMGTDAGVGEHGQNLEEIELMIANGMAPVDALASATSVAARLLGDESIGAIAVGRKADLVLFDTDLRDGGAEKIRQHTIGVWQAGVRVR